MPSSKLIETHSGLRGRPGLDITGADVSRTVGGLAALLAERGLPSTAGLAEDGRAENGSLIEQVLEAAKHRGIDVVDFGVTSTPGAKLAARSRGLGCAMIVTGSHLPEGWSGMKLALAPDYLPLDMQALPAAPAEPSSPNGGLEADDVAARLHAEAVCKSVDVDAIRDSGLRGSVEGGAGDAAALALERLGCDATHGPGDVGFLLDSDGDRLGLVDERGDRLNAEHTLALCAIACRARRVVKGADTSRAVDELVAAEGGSVRTVQPGELHLLEALIETDGDLAGEGNGGVVIPAVGMARDGLAAAAAILDLLARSEEPLSSLAAKLPRYAMRRSRLGFERREVAREGLVAVAGDFGVTPGPPYVGFQIERGDGTWALVRESATESVLRITAEARIQADADALHDELSSSLVHKLKS